MSGDLSIEPKRCTHLPLPVQVSTALPAVDTKGTRTPAHIQLKLKKLQVSRHNQPLLEFQPHPN